MPDDDRGTVLESGEGSSKKPAAERSASSATRAAKTQTKDRDMGAALRTVYQRTVDEAIPADLLDLLGKLD
ncbi:MAG: NepR family anti-sigma factor [Sphingomonas sp.]